MRPMITLIFCSPELFRAIVIDGAPAIAFANP